MKKRFVVLLQNPTKEQNDAFLEWIKEQRVGWWHWFQHAWLLSNATGNLSAQVIRDKLCELFGSKNNFVIELSSSEDTWAGFGPSSGEKDMFNWIKSNWHKT